MDYVDEMINYNESITDKKLIKLLLFRFGICDKAAIDGLEYADDMVIEDFLASLAISDETVVNFLDYLRS